VTIETVERERRLLVDGVLRHTWQDDFTALRGRIAIGVRKTSLTVRSLEVRPLGTEPPRRSSNVCVSEGGG
jgi:hypothetical protein